MRLRHVSENVANADTPGYQRKIVTFEESLRTGLVETGPVQLDRTPGLRIHETTWSGAHPGPTAFGFAPSSSSSEARSKWAFSIANKVQIPEGEIEKLKRLVRAANED